MKKKLSENELLEALTESDVDFSNDDDFDWIPEFSDSDSDSEPDIDPLQINEMFFEDGINTEDEGEQDSSKAIPKSIGLNFHHVKRYLHLLENEN